MAMVDPALSLKGNRAMLLQASLIVPQAVDLGDSYDLSSNVEIASN